MECAAKGLVAEPCAGEARRRCGGCGAVAYCSRAHQTVHWGFHKEECARLAEQMSRIDMLKQFPFTFSVESPAPNHTFPSLRCFLLESFKLHQKGLWKSECICDPEVTSVKDLSKTTDWSMGSALCPCTEPEHNVSTPLTSWKDYYSHLLYIIAFNYRTSKPQNMMAKTLYDLRKNYISLRCLGNYVHYFQVSIFTLNLWDQQFQNLVTFKLRKGLYHERYSDIVKDSKPHLIVAPNAGIAAYPSWIPTIEIIRKVGIPAIFTDFCEEAAHLASSCITSITGQPLRVPLAVHPIRQA
uniref:MYND-type domain-containing protein n=1 Tax=Oryza rufipogon TaxID=4529 RepID=A0A0E0Q864_ORYRU